MHAGGKPDQPNSRWAGLAVPLPAAPPYPRLQPQTRGTAFLGGACQGTHTYFPIFSPPEPGWGPGTARCGTRLLPVLVQVPREMLRADGVG